MTNEDSRFCVHSRAPEETLAAAQVLAPLLPKGGLLLNLTGDLGTGKTHFVKGLAAGLGLDERIVTSPTFALVNEYEGEGQTRLVHMDFYRLESEMALEEVGFLDLLALQTVLAVEWGNRFPGSLPKDRLDVHIERLAAPDSTAMEEVSEDSDAAPRELHLAALGPVSGKVLEGFREALQGRGSAG